MSNPGPDLNIYAITRHRDLVTLNSFIELHVDRAANEERGDEDLMIRRLDASSSQDDESAYEWEPARTLTHILTRALDFPRRAFTIYLNLKPKDSDGAILSFTADNQVILGLCVNDSDESPQNLQRAKMLLTTIMKQFNCYAGFIASEEPSPIDEVRFMACESKPYVIFVKNTDGGAA